MHLNVTPSPPPGVTAPEGGLTALGFHQDSGLQADCEYRPAPRFSLKVGYYLSDVSTPLRGNTWIVPGSHLSTEPLAVQDDGLPKGAMPVCCPSNSALIFDRRLYHTGSPNFAAEPRVAGFVGYAYRWLRPKEPKSASLWCPSLTRQSVTLWSKISGSAPSTAKQRCSRPVATTTTPR